MKRLLNKGRVLSLVILVSLLLAALTPDVVFAEGEAPEAAPPVEAPVVTTTEEVSAAVQMLAEGSAALVDADGTAIPLASQAALDVICDPDPWFYCSVGCVGGKSPFHNTINQALTNWGTYKGKGYIYLEGGFNRTENVSINGGSNPALLTIKGIVWDTKTAGAKPILIGKIEVQNLKAGFTLQGLAVTSNSATPAIYFHDNIGTIKLSDVSVTNSGGTGISITNKGSIILNQVAAVNNGNFGAYVYNSYWTGTKWISSGNITITNSSFNRNGLTAGTNLAGLIIDTYGNILLNGVTGFSNNGDGAGIGANGKSLIIKNSLFSMNTANPNDLAYGYGIRVFAGATASITLENVGLEDNEADGAFLNTTGNILLKNVSAADNGRYGVYISKDYNVPGAGANNITVMNSSFYHSNNTNLEIHASGTVKITNLYSSASITNLGLYVDNYAFNTMPKPVTILGAVLNNNAGNGGYIASDGTITVAGMTVLGNGGTGLMLKNDWGGATGSMVVSSSLGLNQFNYNSGYGLLIHTYKNAGLASTQANGNTSYGVTIIAVGTISNVSLVSVEAGGNLGSYGVRIYNSGTVNLSKVIATKNSGTGIYINNTWPPIARAVKISNSIANNNGMEGIVVNSVGAITLSGVTASGNLLFGATLNNAILSLPATQVPQGVSVTKSTFDGNGNSGVYIVTQRKVSLVSINASANHWLGIDADNSSSTVNSPIVISGISRILRNGLSTGYTGIYLNSKGAIAISGVTSSWNGNSGIDGYSTGGGVTIKNSQVEGNANYGILMQVHGTTVLSGISSNYNGFSYDGHGVYVYTPVGKVSISNSIIMGNSGWGLLIDVTTPATDAYVSPTTIVIGNDTGPAYDDGNVWVY